MQLKRRLVGLREPARGPGGSRKPHGSAGFVGGSRVGPALPRGAGQRRLPSTRRASGEVALRLRGDRTAWRAAVRGRPRRALRSFARCGTGRLRSAAAPRREVSRSGALRAVPWDGRDTPVGEVRQLVPRSLASEWLHPTRLETRTKECNMRASLWVANPSAQ